MVCVGVSAVTGVFMEEKKTEEFVDDIEMLKFEGFRTLYPKLGHLKDEHCGTKAIIGAAGGACWAFTTTWMYHILTAEHGASSGWDTAEFKSMCRALFRIRKTEKWPKSKKLKFPNGYGFPIDGEAKTASVDYNAHLPYFRGGFASKDYLGVACIQKSMYFEEWDWGTHGIRYGNQLLHELSVVGDEGESDKKKNNKPSTQYTLAFAIGFNSFTKKIKNGAHHYVPGRHAFDTLSERSTLCYHDGYDMGVLLEDFCDLMFCKSDTTPRCFKGQGRSTNNIVEYPVERLIMCRNAALIFDDLKKFAPTWTSSTQIKFPSNSVTDLLARPTLRTLASAALAQREKMAVLENEKEIADLEELKDVEKPDVEKPDSVDALLKGYEEVFLDLNGNKELTEAYSEFEKSFTNANLDH